MPIPFLLAGLGIAAGLVGAGGHISAKETNERAQQISEEAQELYNNAKLSLETAQKRTETSLLDLGYSKKNVLDTSIQQFFIVYNRIKESGQKQSDGLNEINKFTIDEQGIIELREMSNIYQSAFKSSIAGAAAGTAIALAASGSLPVVTGVLSTAGTALLAGEVGIATSLAGSALSFGAAMTPLAAIAAPVVLFTGISSSMKADENLEKAETMYSEAELAAESMKTSEVLCDAIAERADMFKDLLVELDKMFAQCVVLLDAVTKRKTGLFRNKKIDASNLTTEEKKLVAVTRSLAGAIKAVIDVPILTEDGQLSDLAQEKYEETVEALPALENQTNEVKAYAYNTNAIPDVSISNQQTGQKQERTKKPLGILTAARNIFALLLATFMFIIVWAVSDKFLFGSIAFTITKLLIMNTHTQSKFFKALTNISHFALAIEFSALLYYYSTLLVEMKYFVICDILTCVVSFFLAIMLFPSQGKIVNNMRCILMKIFGCIFLATISLLIFALLFKLFGISFTVSIIIVEILYVPFSLIVAFI